MGPCLLQPQAAVGYIPDDGILQCHCEPEVGGLFLQRDVMQDFIGCFPAALFDDDTDHIPVPGMIAMPAP